MGSLAGKVAIITGASRGIGKAIALAVAGQNATVVIAARSAEPLEEATREIKTKTGSEVLPLICDVAKLEDLQKLVNITLKRYKKIDILINNAGVSSQSPFEKQDINDFEKLAYTNYLGYVRLIRLVINHMIENKSGAIVNMVSGSTLCDPLPRNFLVYSSLKVGLRAFLKGLFWEMRDHGIKVTSLLPGVTNTDLTGKLKDITADESRLMTTEAIEKAVIFALTVPANVCPLEISVINQKTPWTKPVIPAKQDHPER